MMIPSYLPNSPKSVALDFFLWSCVKDMVCRIKVRDNIDLQHRIAEATTTGTVATSMLAIKWHKIEQRLDILRATDEALAEMCQYI